MPRSRWPIARRTRRTLPTVLPAVLAGTVLLGGLAACSGDDGDGDGAATTTAAAVAAASTTAPPTVGPTAPTVAPTTAPPATTTPATTTPPSLTTPASVITDTAALGGSSISTVDLTTGSVTRLGNVGTEVGVLGIAVAAGGSIDAVTDAPALVVLDPAALDAPVAPTPVDAGGDTLLALARRPPDDALFAIGDSGAVVRLADDGTVTPVAEIALDDPGVGLDVTADGNLEVVVATGARYAVDVDTGQVGDLPALTGDEAPPHVVAVAHDGATRFGIDAAVDELVTIADDGTVTTVGPLGFDVTDGASLDIDAAGVAVLANPG